VEDFREKIQMAKNYDRSSTPPPAKKGLSTKELPWSKKGGKSDRGAAQKKGIGAEPTGTS